jgi:hypothetical protein
LNKITDPTTFEGVPHETLFGYMSLPSVKSEPFRLDTPLTIEERVRAQQTAPVSLTGKLIWAGLDIPDVSMAHETMLYIEDPIVRERLRSLFGDEPVDRQTLKRRFDIMHELSFTHEMTEYDPVVYQLERDGVRLYLIGVDHGDRQRRNIFVKVEEIKFKDLIRIDLGLYLDIYTAQARGSVVDIGRSYEQFNDSIRQLCTELSDQTGLRLLRNADIHNKFRVYWSVSDTFPSGYYRRDGTNSEAGYTLFIARRDREAFLRIMPTQELEK